MRGRQQLRREGTTRGPSRNSTAPQPRRTSCRVRVPWWHGFPDQSPPRCFSSCRTTIWNRLRRQSATFVSHRFNSSTRPQQIAVICLVEKLNLFPAMTHLHFCLIVADRIPRLSLNISSPRPGPEATPVKPASEPQITRKQSVKRASRTGRSPRRRPPLPALPIRLPPRREPMNLRLCCWTMTPALKSIP